MNVLFVLSNRPRYSGTTAYAESLTSELQRVLTKSDTFVLSETKEWGRELVTRVKLNQPDLIHVLYASPSDTFRIGFLLRHCSIPRAVTIHNVPPKESSVPYLYRWPCMHRTARNARYFYSRIFLLKALKYYSVLIVPNPDMKEELEALSKRTVHAIPLALNSTESSSALESDKSVLRNLTLNNRKPVLITVGAFVFSKGVDRVLSALTTLVKEYPNLTYIAAGTNRDPAYFRYLQCSVRSRGLSGYVSFLPDADYEVVKALYTACDVYVQPSYEEGFCLTVLQALLTERNREKPFALVGSRTGEIPRMMELAGMSEFLFEAHSSPALEGSLQLALRAVASGFSPLGGRQRILAAYSWERIAKQTYKTYERVTVCQ